MSTSMGLLSGAALTLYRPARYRERPYVLHSRPSSCPQVGTIFNLVDSLACGTVGVLVTARSRLATLEKAQDTLKFIRRLVS